MARKSMTKEEKKEKKERVRALFAEFDKTKDPKIRDELIKEHMYLPEILAKKYTGRGIEYDDIFQIACIGLILAVDRYDFSRGYEFSSYATPTIIGEIKRYFRDKGWTIKVPRRVQELSKKITNAKNQLMQELGEVPTAKEIADLLEISEEEVIEVMEASKVYQPGSLDISIDSGDDGNELYLSDIIGDEDPTYDRVENLDFIKRELEKYNDIERTIVIERYINRKTQIQIAKELNISQMTVSRIEKRVIREIQKDAREHIGVSK
ncbi:MAG: SigB/SigF/SigG family RNA polymerase sigma factor [Ezakiella sp.]|nr:SigB/SigF/SigG family RNA polymerase sigma factor [Bacillota bacterium]MDY3947231.1 SigB/SigF/SigG family RNA polymerase sigma factor [Ezakiella sp.]